MFVFDILSKIFKCKISSLWEENFTRPYVKRLLLD